MGLTISMVEPASSSLKRLPLSTAWLLRRSRQPVLHCKQSYLLHHLTTWRGRDSSPPEQEGLILSKTEIDLPPTTTISAAKKHSRPSATAAAKTKEADRALQQLWATSEDHKVHSVEKSLKPSCKMPEGSEENLGGAEDLASTSRAATTNPQKYSLTVIPLKPLFQRDGPSQG